MFPIVYALFSRIYKFISYNRKVIYPSEIYNPNRNCEPRFNLKYRILYLLSAIGSSLFLLGKQSHILLVIIICTCIMVWLILFFPNSHNTVLPTKMEYFGNYSTALLMSSALHFTAETLNAIIFQSTLVTIFLGIYYFIFLTIELNRRFNIIEINQYLVNEIKIKLSMQN